MISIAHRHSDAYTTSHLRDIREDGAGDITAKAGAGIPGRPASEAMWLAFGDRVATVGNDFYRPDRGMGGNPPGRRKQDQRN